MATHETGQFKQQQAEQRSEIERIMATYIAACEAGQPPDLQVFLARYPHFAEALSQLILYYHAYEVDLPAPDAVPAPLSAATQGMLARITGAASAEAAPAPEAAAAAPAIESLTQQALAAGLDPVQLAERVGIGLDMLGKLEAHVIRPNTIPPTFVRRLAQALATLPETVAAFLGVPLTPTAAFFYADQAPAQQRQESFLEAVQTSMAAPEQKRAWEEITRQELPGA